ncbi:conserved hypothetical protein, secreted [Candidatus Magnetomorum sp. HK-1]|nr:conserved hypothetical protein, secreted [Candidatus Magnetomorum sp. HK-1]
MKQLFIKIFLLFSFIVFGLICNSMVSAQTDDSLLMEISSENLYDGSIKVLFILSEVLDPKMFYYKGQTPKVVCDFANVSIKPGLKQDIRVNKRYIKNVRMGEHHQPHRKVRVVLDLVPGKKYTVKEIPPEPNIFAVIIRAEEDDQQQKNDSEISESSITETKPYKPSRYQDTYRKTSTIKTTTTTTSTVTAPTTIARTYEQPVEDMPQDEPESIEEKDQDFLDEDDEDDKSDTKISSEKMSSWYDSLKKNGEGLEPPYRWPIEKTFGKIKMIVHLDTDLNGFLSLKGYMINMSDDFFYRIQLHFDVFNSNADVIEQAYGDFFNVEPGERRKMNIHIGVKTASNFLLMNKIFW